MMNIYLDRLVEGDNKLSFSKEDILDVDFLGCIIKDAQGIDVEITKRDDYLYIKGFTQVMAEVDCIRCGEPFDQDIQTSFEYIFYQGIMIDGKDSSDDTIVYLKKNDTLIDFSEYYREAIILSISDFNLCSEGCLGRCHTCGTNLNYETCSCDKTKPIDLRWESLAKIAREMKEN